MSIRGTRRRKRRRRQRAQMRSRGRNTWHEASIERRNDGCNCRQAELTGPGVKSTGACEAPPEFRFPMNLRLAEWTACLEISADRWRCFLPKRTRRGLLSFGPPPPAARTKCCLEGAENANMLDLDQVRGTGRPRNMLLLRFKASRPLQPRLRDR